MKALTLYQPWATIIVHGPKRIENRRWAPPIWLMKKRIAIHAGQKFDIKTWSELAKHIPPEFRSKDVPRGAILGTAILDSVVAESLDMWFSGPFGWVLKDIVAFPEPIPCRGWQKLWNVPEDLLLKFPSAALQEA